MKTNRTSILFTDASQPAEGMDIIRALMKAPIVQRRASDDFDDDGLGVYPLNPRGSGGPSGAPAFAGMTFDVPQAFTHKPPVYSIAC